MSGHKRFYNFDGLRFFAAFLVVISHTENIKKKFGYPSFYDGWFFSSTAALAVTFFFVLSGFLIAFLLMQEMKRNAAQRVDLTRFYRNRALRIWPLYYLLVFLSFVVLPHIPLFQSHNYDGNFLRENTKSFAGYLSFLPNYTEYRFGNIIYLGQLWSLGVEEFFYLLFPLGFYLVPARRQLRFFIAIIVLSITVNAVSKIWCSAEDMNVPLACIYISRYRLYAFGLGTLSAYLYLNSKDNIVLLAAKKHLRVAGRLLFVVTVVLMFSKVELGPLLQPFFAVLFAVLLFLFTASGIRIRLLNHPYIIYLGKISYGIYMLHPIAIVAAIRLFYLSTGNAFLDAVWLELITMILTVILSVISYYGFERLFLFRQKKRPGIS